MAREQALSLLAAANNHGDLAVKLSSLKQVKDIFLSIEPSQAAELYPYLVELQSSPEILVRKYLLEVIDDIGAKTREHLFVLFPVLLAFLRDSNPVVVKQSIITGTKIFCIVLEELAFQFQRRGIVERWLEELWAWLIKFRDAIHGLILEATSVGPKLLAVKFLETYVLRFTLESNDFETCNSEATWQGRVFNISWIVDGHPVLDPPALMSDANRYLGFLMDMLLSASKYPGSVTIAVVNSLAAIARKRPTYYKSILTALLDFSPSSEAVKARHIVSIQYSLRTAYLGFLRCSHPTIAESRERLLKELRAMNAGDAADQVIRQIDKMMKNNERASRDLQLSKDDQLTSQFHISGDLTKKRLAPLDNEDQNNNFDVSSKRFRYGPNNNATVSVDASVAGHDHVNGISPKLPVLDGDLTPVEQMIAMIGALIAEGERGVEPLEILISNIHADLLADIVITNMRHLPKNPPPLTKFGNMSLSRSGDFNDQSQIAASNGFATSTQTLDLSDQLPTPPSNMSTLQFSDVSASANLTIDTKRDPRRDPRRLDPRRMTVPVDVPPASVAEDNVSSAQYLALQSDYEASSSTNAQILRPPSVSESNSQPLMSAIQTDIGLSESPAINEVDESIMKHEDLDVKPNVRSPDRDVNHSSHLSPVPVSKVEDTAALPSMDAAMLNEAYSPSSQETDQLSPDILVAEAYEISSAEFPMLPPYIELAEDHQRHAIKLALERIIREYQNPKRTDLKQTQIALVARLFAQAGPKIPLII